MVADSKHTDLEQQRYGSIRELLSITVNYAHLTRVQLLVILPEKSKQMA
jgi:hypothetical protein